MSYFFCWIQRIDKLSESESKDFVWNEGRNKMDDIISIVPIASKTFNENFYDQDGIKQPIVGRRFNTKRAK